MSVHEVKLCLLGDSGVGKSSIVHRFVYDAFKPAMESTIGDHSPIDNYSASKWTDREPHPNPSAAFLTKSVVVDGNTYKYQIWDTAGQEKYRALAPMYYRGAAAAIIVYDITREGSFDAMKSWITELKKHGSPNIVLAIAGNKVDLEDLREVSYRNASDYAHENNAVFVETSAKTAVSVPALFMEISKQLSLNPEFEAIGSTGSGALQLSPSPTQPKKKKCCT